jgi:hypothetical protein
MLENRVHREEEWVASDGSLESTVAMKTVDSDLGFL